MDNLRRILQEPEQVPPLRAARARRTFAASLYRLGPLSLGILGLVLISLLALLYLNLVALATKANQDLQDLSARQAQLQQQNQALQEQQGTLQSPAYIGQRASEMGMVPADPSTVQTIVLAPQAPDAGRSLAPGSHWRYFW
jgi:cell division protein FtsL